MVGGTASEPLASCLPPCNGWSSTVQPDSGVLTLTERSIQPIGRPPGGRPEHFPGRTVPRSVCSFSLGLYWASPQRPASGFDRERGSSPEAKVRNVHHTGGWADGVVEALAHVGAGAGLQDEGSSSRFRAGFRECRPGARRSRPSRWWQQPRRRGSSAAASEAPHRVHLSLSSAPHGTWSLTASRGRTACPTLKDRSVVGHLAASDAAMPYREPISTSAMTAAWSPPASIASW